MRAANEHLSVDRGQITEENIIECKEAISEGMAILEHRQKMIKLADSSDAGWLAVHEYETNPLADNSDDEKRIFRAQSRADRKIKEDKKKRRESRKVA